MSSRISFNIHAQNLGDTPKLKKHLQAIQPTAVLVMDGVGLCQELKALLPNTIVISRIYPDDDIHNRMSPQEWMNQRAPQAAGGIFQYTTNEAGFSPNLINWHIELCHLAIERNVPLLIGNMSVGTPAPEDWAAGRALFELMNTRRDLFILGLHEYACAVSTSGFLGGYPNNAGVPPGQTNPPGVNLIPSANWPPPDKAHPMTKWHCGRFKFLVDYCKSIGIQTPRIILTEHGFDDVSDIKPWANTLHMTPPYTTIRGWQSCINQWNDWYAPQGWTPEDSLFEQLKYLDQAVYQGSPVEAQLIFCWTGKPSQWDQFDVSKALTFQQRLEQYAATVPPVNPPQPIPFPPADDPSWKAATIAPASSTAAHVRSQPFTSAASNGLISQPESGWIAPEDAFTASDGIWYPLRVKNDSLQGWSRGDVITFTLTPEPEPPDPQPPEVKTYTFPMTIVVRASNEEAASLMARYMQMSLNMQYQQLKFDDEMMQYLKYIQSVGMISKFPTEEETPYDPR